MKIKMTQLDDLVHYTYEHLFDINPDALVSRNPIKMKSKLPARVMDDTTVDMIEIPRLFRAINYTKTITGAATLFRSLVQPLTSLELIHAKQDSVRELEEDVELSYKLNEYVRSLVEKEPDLYGYFFAEYPSNITAYTQYSTYRRASVFFKRLVDGIKNIPIPQTPYLETLVDDIRSIDGTHGIELIKGPVYSTFSGLKPRSEVRLFTPRIKFTLRSIKPTLLTPLLIPALSTLTCNTHLLSMVVATLPYGLFALSLPRDFDYKHFTLPLRDIYVVDSNIRKSIDAIGKIDELLSFHEYAKAMRSKGIEMTMPIVTDTSQHYFVAKEARNPILLSKNSYCVPNNITLKGQKITFVTGPQSYGKSTCFKTVTQIQVMAQIGDYVPCLSAEMANADHIFYQRAKSDTLEDREGTFGAELTETRDYFFRSTPRSLVVLDRVLAGATTYEEAFEQFYGIMHDFHKKGNNTVLITFDPKLVDKFEQEGIGQYLTVNLSEIYRLVQGISRKGHADLVAKRLGFSPEDRKNHLRDKGYLSRE